MALRIQVLGRGLIPRGLGLAPRLTPFPADQTLCYTILNTNGLSIKFVHPESGNLLPLTTKNLKRMFELYDGKAYKEADKKQEKVSNPVAPVNHEADKPVKVEPETPVVETKQEEVKEEVVVDEVKEADKEEETKEDSTLKPINKPEENKNNNNYKNYNNNKNYQNNKK